MCEFVKKWVWWSARIRRVYSKKGRNWGYHYNRAKKSVLLWRGLKSHWREMLFRNVRCVLHLMDRLCLQLFVYISVFKNDYLEMYLHIFWQKRIFSSYAKRHLLFFAICHQKKAIKLVYRKKLSHFFRFRSM